MFKNNSSGFYTSLFIENMIKLYEGKVNYRTNDFILETFSTHALWVHVETIFTVAPGGNNLATICYKDFLGLATINMYYYYYYYYYSSEQKNQS